MRVLIACEFSGVVRSAFRRVGHDAWSCDLLDSEDGSEHHLIGDCLGCLDDGWDLMVCFPPCTHLAVSGARWFGEKLVEQGEAKATSLWLKNLPKLRPTKIVDGREPRVHFASPGPDRWKERSRTLPGIAQAMAAQWGKTEQELPLQHELLT